MAEVIFRFPSKVPYGYVEVKMERVMGNLDSSDLAAEYVREFTTYRDAEAKALDSLNSTPPKSPPAMPKSVDEVLDEDEAKELIKSKLGATEVDGEEDAPWNNKPEAEEKPYVTPASEDDWDF